MNTRDYLDIIAGAKAGTPAAVIRAGLRLIEPVYAGITILRNHLYDARRLPATRLARPVVSIGNLTTGGTGKTPMIRFLAEVLRCEGLGVAILSRGYKSVVGELGDEQLMLDRFLNSGATAPVILKANPDRVEAAAQALAESPGVSVFLLDDGFQHRRVARELDVVLISAIEPFGYGHILPRGLLREGLRGLRRAHVVVITHADRVDESAVAEIETTVRQHNAHVPILRAIHAHCGFRSATAGTGESVNHLPGELAGRRFFAFCGLADPEVLLAQLQSAGGVCVGHCWLVDHHRYKNDDLLGLMAEALSLGAEVMITTEKDWVKIQDLPAARDSNPPIWRTDIELKFQADGREKLCASVLQAIKKEFL